MFNSTHTLAGIAVSRAGAERWAPYATWTAIIASNLPDADSVFGFLGTATYLEQHRGLSHSIIGIPILSLAVALVMRWLAAKRRKAPVPLFNHFGIAFLAMATHPFLDLANPYGLRPFLPFSSTWFYGDTLFIFDPILDFVLLTGVIAASRAATRRAMTIALTTALVLGYAGLRVELHRRAVALVPREVQKFTVVPTMLDPFLWTALLDTDKEIVSATIEVRSSTLTEDGVMVRATQSPAIDAAEKTESVKALRRFARLTVERVEPTSTGFDVYVIDVRFYRPQLGRALAVKVSLDRSLNVLSESLSFTLPVQQ